MRKSRLQLIIGCVIICSIINMPTTRPTASTFSDNGINTIDKMIKETNDNRIKQEEQNKINMLNEMGKGLVEINKKKQDEERIKELNKHRRRILFHITYYTNSYEEGGIRDTKGKLLENHKYPIIAMPSDVPYGSRVEFDKTINGSNEFISVDSGNAIQWINDNECVVDVFVPNASQNYLNKLGRDKCYGWLYDLGY